MQEKLLLLVVEEMTSLSRIIRSANASNRKNEAVTIEIRNLFSRNSLMKRNEVEEAEPQITLEEIYMKNVNG